MSFSSPDVLNVQYSGISKSCLPRIQLWFWLLRWIKMTIDALTLVPLPVGWPVTLLTHMDSRWDDMLVPKKWSFHLGLLEPKHHVGVWLPYNQQAWEDMDRHSGGYSQLCPAFRPSPSGHHVWPAQLHTTKWLQSTPCGAQEPPSWALPKFLTLKIMRYKNSCCPKPWGFGVAFCAAIDKWNSYWASGVLSMRGYAFLSQGELAFLPSWNVA